MNTWFTEGGPDDLAPSPTTTTTPSQPTREPRGNRFASRFVPSLASALIASILTAAVVTYASPTPSQTAANSSTPNAASSSSVTLDVTNAVVNVAAKASPAVVTITNSSVSTYGPYSIPSTGVGSGFIFDANGWILTNRHVVAGGGTLTVELKDGRKLSGRVVATDPQHDLAVVKVDARSLPSVQLGTSSNLQVGQLVVAIGSPLGTFTDSVTSGILSATGRSITVGDQLTRQARRLTNLLQTDAAINPGNSGGPLLNSSGQVIGINTAAAASAEGIGFAVPIDDAAALIQRARSSPS